MRVLHLPEVANRETLTEGASMAGGGTAIDVTIAGREAAAADGWERVWGTASGAAGPRDGVVGLDADHRWTSEFEVIGPVDGSHRAVLVDTENRGGRSTYAMIEPEVRAGRVAYARIQWQTGHAAGVPEEAQGVGLVILREFGRWLRERFRVMVLAGASQSAWCVNTFVAEGFNVARDGAAVFDGAFAYLSGGNWLAVNRWGDDGAPPVPYARPDGVPAPAADLLTRPATDPFLVEISSYTDYYRLRASRSADAPLPARARHYDFPSPHAPGTVVPSEAVFGMLRCNRGREVPMNPIGAGPAVRATLLGLFRELGATGLPDDTPVLAPSVFFDLVAAPPPSEHFNALPGVELRVPRVDADAQPVGGVRLPDVELPLGRAEPVALSPCGTASIDDVCGNFGGWQPFSPDQLRARYGEPDEYAARYSGAYDALVAQGFALASERDPALDGARRAYGEALSRPG
jgi:hypothetical protein